MDIKKIQHRAEGKRIKLIAYKPGGKEVKYCNFLSYQHITRFMKAHGSDEYTEFSKEEFTKTITENLINTGRHYIFSKNTTFEFVNLTQKHKGPRYIITSVFCDHGVTKSVLFLKMYDKFTIKEMQDFMWKSGMIHYADNPSIRWQNANVCKTLYDYAIDTFKEKEQFRMFIDLKFNFSIQIAQIVRSEKSDIDVLKRLFLNHEYNFAANN